MNFYNKHELYNAWTEVSMDYLLHEENREEAENILNKMFSFDSSEAKSYWDDGYKRLQELKEDKIIECINKRYYMMFGGVRE